jgi:hypothetical protein
MQCNVPEMVIRELPWLWLRWHTFYFSTIFVMILAIQIGLDAIDLSFHVVTLH